MDFTNYTLNRLNCILTHKYKNIGEDICYLFGVRGEGIL